MARRMFILTLFLITLVLTLSTKLLSVGVTVPVVHGITLNQQNSAGAIAQILPNPEQLAQQGKQRYDSGQYAAAVDIWQQAAEAYHLQHDWLNQAMALSNLSLTYQKLGQWGEANRAITKSLTLLDFNPQHPPTELKSDRYKQILAPSLDIQGHLQWLIGQPENALITWQQAAQIYVQLGDQAKQTQNLLNQAQALQSLGQYLQAQRLLEPLQQTLLSTPDSLLKVRGLRSLGNVYRHIGEINKSQKVLQQTLKIAAELQQPQGISAVQLDLGNTERALWHKAQVIGKTEEAKNHLQAALKQYQNAAKGTRVKTQALLNHLSLLLETEQWESAQDLLPKIQESLAELSPSRRSIFAQINLAKSLIKLSKRQELEMSELSSYHFAKTSSVNNLKAKGTDVRLVGNAQPMGYPKFQRSKTNQNPELFRSAQLLATAIQQAHDLHDNRAKSYGYGTLGRLYEDTHQLSEAREITNKALILTQGMNAADISYRWQWQLGRLLKKQTEITQNKEMFKDAIAYYTAAVDTLQSVRRDLISINPDVRFSFRDNVEPLYREFIDLLLTTPGNSPPSQANLQHVIQLFDALQLAELEDHLRCSLPKSLSLNQVTDPKAAIIYPIILKNRIAVILQLPGKPLIYRETWLNYRKLPLEEKNIQISKYQDVDKINVLSMNGTSELEDVEKTIKTLRKSLTEPDSTPDVIEQAQKLYRWIIKPIEQDLDRNHHIETLVFVLDGSLRNIPMSVLYDGEKYLVEKNYALAVAPRLELFEPKPTPHPLHVFRGGVGEPQVINGKSFEPIDKLTEELDGIAREVMTSQPLVNADFTKARLEEHLKTNNFSAIHIKTHGVFSSDPEETYIVAYQELLQSRYFANLIEIGSQEKTKPIELLVLSACETAKGDSRAVLGLAGIAVRSGARSTLSTLWIAKDIPNTKLMIRFYEKLSQPGMTKAKALHLAQLDLFHQGYKAPYIWATYLLVGNWL